MEDEEVCVVCVYVGSDSKSKVMKRRAINIEHFATRFMFLLCFPLMYLASSEIEDLLIFCIIRSVFKGVPPAWVLRMCGGPMKFSLDPERLEHYRHTKTSYNTIKKFKTAENSSRHWREGRV